MVDISIRIEGYEQFRAKLARVGVDLSDFREELGKAGQDLVDYFSTVPFATNGRAYGNGGWKPVTPRRLAYKLKHYPQNAHNILQASGDMRNNFKFTAARNLLTVVNDSPQFAAHQLGLGNMPQRVMMAVSRTVRDAVVRDIETGIQAKINKVK